MSTVHISVGTNTSVPSSALVSGISQVFPSAVVSTPADPEKHCILGVWFEIDDRTPYGDASQLAQASVNATPVWAISQETYFALTAQSSGIVGSIIGILKQAEREGRNVVTGIVSVNSRRGAQTSPRPKRANLDDLRQRCRNLVVQIATLSDDGPLSEGAVKELSKTYAALQSERDEAYEAFAEIDQSLSIGRAIIIESTM